MYFAGNAAGEVHSAYLPRGKVSDTRPVVYGFGNLDCRSADYGYLRFQYWSLHCLTAERKDIQWRRCCVEEDYAFLYGYDWKAIEDVLTFKTLAGSYWVTLDGYREAMDHSDFEWYFREEVVNPYLTPYTQLRKMVHPYSSLFARAGVKRSVPIAGGVSFEPNTWLDGGDGHWQTRRYPSAAYRGREVSGGFGTGVVDLRLQWKVAEAFRVYGGVREFCALAQDIRHRTETDGNPYTRKSFTDFYLAAAVSF